MRLKKILLLVFLSCQFGSMNNAAPSGVPTFDLAAIEQMRIQVTKAREMIQHLKDQLDAVRGNALYVQQLYREIEALRDEIKSMRNYIKFFSNPRNILNMSAPERIRLISEFKAKKLEAIDREQNRIIELAAMADKTKDIKQATDLKNLIDLEKLKLEQRKIEIATVEEASKEAIKLAQVNAVMLDSCKVSRRLGIEDLAQYYCSRVISQKVVNDNLIASRQAKTTGDSSSSSSESKSEQDNSGWRLGKTSAKYESGNSGPGTINNPGNRKFDKGGASYGLYQMSEKSGTIQQYQKYTKYNALKGLKPGTAEFDRAWKEVARQDPKGFAEEQHAFVKKNYYDRENARLKRKGMDFSNRGAGIQDMIWSTSVQYGNKTIIESALKGHNVSEMSDAQIISVVQDYKLAHHKEHFASSYRKGLKEQSIISRIKQEKLDLLRITK